jgi:hypothetical protein
MEEKRETGNSTLKVSFGSRNREFHLPATNFSEGNLGRLQENPDPPLLLPRNGSVTTTDVDINLFNLYPDPVHFVDLLKRLERGDIASNIFLELLENYRDMKERPGDDPMKYVSRVCASYLSMFTWFYL